MMKIMDLILKFFVFLKDLFVVTEFVIKQLLATFRIKQQQLKIGCFFQYPLSRVLLNLFLFFKRV